LNKLNAQRIVAAAVAWVLLLGALTVWLDNAITGPDGLLPHCFNLAQFLTQGRWSGLSEWLWSVEVHPPLPYVYSTLVAMLFTFELATVRFSCVLLHALVLVQVYLLARTLWRDRTTAAVACLLAATHPMMLGWFRLDYQDPHVTVLVLATLQQAVRTDLRSSRSAALLGVLLGLGALTKLSYCALMVVPAFLYLGVWIRGRRSAANAALAILTAVAICGWWYLVMLDLILKNFVNSTSGNMEVLHKVRLYLLDSPGNLVLNLLAAVGLLTAWPGVRRGLRDAPIPLLIGSTWAAGTLLFFFLFDYSPRYLLPLSALACVLGARPLSGLLRRVARGAAAPRRAAAWAALVLVLASAGAWPHLVGHSEDGRERGGLLAPDKRDLEAMERAWRWAAKRGVSHVLVVPSDHEALSARDDLVVLARLRAGGRPRPLDWAVARHRLERGRAVVALLLSNSVAQATGAGRSTLMWETEGQDLWRWVDRWRRVTLGVHRDQGPHRVQVVRLLPDEATESGGSRRSRRQDGAGAGLPQ
jgi:hypothetical protein